MPCSRPSCATSRLALAQMAWPGTRIGSTCWWPMCRTTRRAWLIRKRGRWSRRQPCPAGERFLVNIREPAVVAVLSASTFELVGQFPVSGVGPHGLDLDQEGHQVFIACDGGSVVTLENSTGSELAKVSIAGAPDAIWHNHQTSHLYVAIEDPGVIDVVNTESMTVEEQMATEVGAHTTAFDAKRERLYVFLPSCRVAVYEECEGA